MRRRSEQTLRSPVSYPVHVARLPEKGLTVEVEADERQRAELAAAHSVPEVRQFRVELDVRPWKRNGVEVVGRVRADIVQECVVTLEPLENHIDEPVEAVFLPEQSKLGRQGFDGGGEIMIDPEGADSPETFSGDTVDVGALAEQFFGLAIDPYPRKADAELPGASVPAEEEPAQDWQQKLGELKREP